MLVPKGEREHVFFITVVDDRFLARLDFVLDLPEEYSASCTVRDHESVLDQVNAVDPAVVLFKFEYLAEVNTVIDKNSRFFVCKDEKKINWLT